MDIDAPSLKRCCGSQFAEIFRAVLYHRGLTWGSKCLFMAMLDLPLTANPTNAAMARKLHSSPSQVSVWRQELTRKKIIPRGKIPSQGQGTKPEASI